MIRFSFTASEKETTKQNPRDIFQVFQIEVGYRRYTDAYFAYHTRASFPRFYLENLSKTCQTAAYKSCHGWLFEKYSN